MRKLFTRSLSVVLVILLLVSVVNPAFAATYRNGAQSGPSSSYAGGKYYANYQRVPITGDNRTDLIAIALSQLGYQEGASNGSFSGEVSGSANYVEFSYNLGDLGLGYGGSDFPWCACFVSWCLYQSHCTDQATYKALARYHSGDYTYIWKEISCSMWVKQLKGAGYYKYSAYEGGSYTPKAGDLVFFQNSNGVAHIGICLYTSGGRIYTVEGNTSDASGLETNGGGVYFKNYSLSTSYINGYGVLPYVEDSSVPDIDYSGANPTPGLYVSNATKYIYGSETDTTYDYLLPRFTMFEVTEVCSNGRLKIEGKCSTGATVTGYILNNSDRVIQLSSTETNATETARVNLQSVITESEQLRHYNYTEAQITQLRAVYTDAVGVLNNSAATEAELTAAAAALRNEMYLTGTNTIARNNEGVYINGRNGVITAGDCFMYSPTWNDGLITVDNANIRYTLNVVFKWDSSRQVNVVKSISTGSGSSTPAIQLEDDEFLVACHDWETGVASGDNPVTYSGTNYRVLSSLSVGDAVMLSGCTALNAGTYVEPAAYLKFIPVDAAQITGENTYVGSGQAVLFTPDFNEGLLTYANANIHNTLNVLAQWDNAKSAWTVVDKFEGNGAADESSNIEIANGQVLIACHVGDTTAAAYNWRNLYAAQVGQEVVFSGVSPTDGANKLSIAANVTFVDYVADEETEQIIPVNVALNKDITAAVPGTALHNADLTDGVYADELAFTGEWFGFACAGSNQNTDENGNGYVTIDLDGQYSLTSIRAHIYAGENEASVAPPSYINVYISNNGTDFVYHDSLTLDSSASASYWAEVEIDRTAARYVRLEVGASGNSTWVFLNEVEVYGTDLTGEEDLAYANTQIGTAAEGHDGYMLDHSAGEAVDGWYGIDTSSGSGSVVIDLGARYQLSQVQTRVYSGMGTYLPSNINVYVSPDGTNYTKVGEMETAEDGQVVWYQTEVSFDTVVGRYVMLEVVSGNALGLLDYVSVYGTPYVQSADSNIAMGKDTVVSGYADSPFTALLNDGLASNIFQYNVNNSSWFAFKNTGDSTTGNVTNNRGIITIDLGGQAEITDVSLHLYAGTNDAGAVQPDYVNVYYSTDGVSFEYANTVNVDTTQTGAYWLKSDYSADPVVGRYVKFALGTTEGDLVLLNEVKVGGLMLTTDEPNEPGTISAVTLAGSFNGWNSTPNMVIVDDTTVSTTLTLEAGSYEFKVLYGNEWYGNTGTITDSTGNSAWVMTTDTDNCTLVATHSGEYGFLFDRDTKELRVAYMPEALYLRGTFNDWGTDIPMENNRDGTYSATVSLTAGFHEFKVANDDYSSQWPSSNEVLNLENNSNVTVTLDIYTNTVTYTVIACEHDYDAVVTAPTCTEKGYTTYICSVCGDTYVADYVDALGHSYVGGTCSVCGTADPDAVTKFSLIGSNMVLGSDLDMNFFFNMTDISGTDSYVVITHHDLEEGEKTYTIAYADWSTYGPYYMVTLDGLAARQMADTIEVVVYNGNGTAVSEVWTDSIRAYALRSFASATQTDEGRTLLVDMLNYGAAAQEFFSYNTGDLANSTLTDEQKAYATDTVSVTDERVKGDNYVGSSLVLKSRIMLTVLFNNVTSDMYATVTYTDHTGEAHELTIQGADFTEYGGYYGVMIDELVVADGGQPVTVTMYNADGSVFGTATDSMNSYAARNLNGESIYEMVAKFTTSAYEYFH